MATPRKHAIFGFVVRVDALPDHRVSIGPPGTNVTWRRVRHDEGRHLERLIPPQNAQT
jgi:hypothetical protein